MEVLWLFLGWLLTLTPEQWVYAWLGGTAFLSLLFNRVGWVRASKVVGSFGADAGRVDRVVRRIWPKLQPALQAWLSRRKASITLLCVSLGLLSGCVGTLDDARGRISPALTETRPVLLTARCEQLSDRGFYFGGGSVALGASGVGAVIAAIPAKNEKQETALMISGIGAAAGSTVLGWFARKSDEDYVEEGCSK